MPLFRVWLQLPGAILALPAPLEVRGSNVFIRATALSESVGPFSPGLLLRVDVEAGSIDEAFETAPGLAVTVLDMLAVSHGVVLRDPDAILAIAHPSADPGQAFGQFVPRLEIDYPLRRSFDPERFGAIFAAIDAIGLDGFKNRVQRALTLYRRHLADHDPVDAFEDMWEALECLNPLLQEKYGLATTVPGTSCPKCGERTHVPASTGIRHAVTALAGKDRMTWDGLRSLRVGIVHGTIHHREAIQRARGALRTMQEAFASALAHLLDLEPKHMASLAGPPLATGSGAHAMLTATLHAEHPVLPETPEGVPYAVPQASTRQAAADASAPGRRTMEIDLAWELRNLPGELRDVEVRLAIATDPRDTGATLEQISQSVRHPDA